MEYIKKDKDSVEVTSKQTVFKADLLSEKETLQARIVELDAMLKSLE